MRWLHVRAITFGLLAIVAILNSSEDAFARAEWVYVAKVLSDDDKGIIVRRDGDAYLIEKRIGCISFWRCEGEQVLIFSPGIFLGIGSKLILPEKGQECRIWDSKELGPWSTPNASTLSQSQDTHIIQSQYEARLLQNALKTLGYYEDDPDSVFGPKTAKALSQFQKENGLNQTGQINPETAIKLSEQIRDKCRDNLDALELAISLLNLEKQRARSLRHDRSGCENGHWISWVSDGGEIIVLEDGSVWQIDSIDTIDTTLWLPTEEIIVCDETSMTNNDNGEKAGVIRMK